MNVLKISNMYPSNRDPIYGNFVKEQKEILQELGIGVEVAAITERDGSAAKKIQKYLSLFINSTIKALKPKNKLIHYHFEYPTALLGPIYKYLLNKKIIITIHGPILLTHTGWKKRLVKWMFDHTDKIVCVSDYLKREVISYYNIPDEKVESIHCGVNNDLFRYEDKIVAKNRLNLPSNKQVVLYIGRMHNEKGMDYYLEAIKEKLNEERYLFLFVGNGPEAELIKELQNNYPDKILYRPGVPKEEVQHYFNAADVFIFPTIMETYGLVALEALSCQTLVIASKVGGVPEIIKHNKTGLLFETGSKESLLEQLLIFESLSEKEKEKMKKEGLTYSEGNTVHHQARKLEKVYMSLLESETALSRKEGR